MTLTAIAIDDEPQALDVVKLHAAKVAFVDLKTCFTDAFAAIAYLQTNQIDLLFLDIKMPDISGVELVKCLPSVPMVVFTTAYADFAVQGFELNAIDYLLKPFSFVRFLQASTKALDIYTLRSDRGRPFIFIKTGYEEEKVMLEDILYIEAEGNYLSFVLKDRKLLSRQTMADLLQTVPSDRFVRIHRSFCVALDKIEKIARQEIIVAGCAIPIGATYEESIALIWARLRNPLSRPY